MNVQNLLISRRKLIKQGAALSLYTMFSCLVKAALKPIKPTDDRVWRDIVDYARWCPSVHNLQPYKLKILSPSEAVLHYDTTRLLPVGDPESIFATVAMGVFIEHLSIAVNPYGLRVEAGILDPITIHKSGIRKSFSKIRS